MNRVIYLHGFASGPSSSKARYFRQRLEAAGFSVAVPDLAAGDFEHLTLSGQMRIIDQAAAGQPAALIGSSMGGYLAALYAARHEIVERIVLLAPAFGFARRWVERIGPAALEDWRTRGTVDVFHYGEGANRALGYQLLDDAAQFEDYPDVRQPCLIFHGTRDDTVPVRYSQEFAGARANVELHALDSGHELLNVLDFMGARTLQFLEEISARNTPSSPAP
jgi:pimeloyl-ACP methyl ester carboxylesterase